MEDFASYYAVVLNNPELRHGLIGEAERLAPSGHAFGTGWLGRRWLATILRGLAAHIEPSGGIWAATVPAQPARLW
jgi:hypothetical protein